MPHQKPGNSPRNPYRTSVLYGIFLHNLKVGHLVNYVFPMGSLDELVKDRVKIGTIIIIESLEEWEL